MSKLSEDSVMQALLDQGTVTTEQAQVIISEAKRIDKMNKPEKTERAPAQPYIMVISDPDGIVPPGLEGFVIQMQPSYVNANGEFSTEEGFKNWYEHEVAAHLRYADGEYRNTKKAQKLPADCVGDLIHDCPSSIMKTAGMRVVSKDPVAIIPINPIDVHLSMAIKGVEVSHTKK